MEKHFLFNPSKLQIPCIVCKHNVLSALNKLTVLYYQRERSDFCLDLYICLEHWRVYRNVLYLFCVWNLSLAFCVWFCYMNWNEEVKQKQIVFFRLFFILLLLLLCVFNYNTCMNYTARNGVKNQFYWPILTEIHVSKHLALIS